MSLNAFERQIMGGGIPFAEASNFFYKVKTAGWTDPPDEEGLLEGQFAAPVEQVVAKLTEVIAAKFRLAVAYQIYAQTMRGLARQSVADDFLEHACQEQEAAEAYLKRAAVLGGGPVHVPEIETPPASSQPIDILMRMARAEQEGIAAQRELRDLVGQDNPLCHQIEDFMVVDQYHLDELWQLLPQDAHPSSPIVPGEGGEGLPAEGGEGGEGGELIPAGEEDVPTEELPPEATGAEGAPPVEGEELPPEEGLPPEGEEEAVAGEELPPEEAVVEEEPAPPTVKSDKKKTASVSLAKLKEVAHSAGEAASKKAKGGWDAWNGVDPRSFINKDSITPGRLAAAGAAGWGLRGALAGGLSKATTSEQDLKKEYGSANRLERAAIRHPELAGALKYGPIGAGLGAGIGFAAQKKPVHAAASIAAPFLAKHVAGGMLDSHLKDKERAALQAAREESKEGSVSSALKSGLKAVGKGAKRYGELVSGSKATKLMRKSVTHTRKAHQVAEMGLKDAKHFGGKGHIPKEVGEQFARKFKRHTFAARELGGRAKSEFRKSDVVRGATGAAVLGTLAKSNHSQGKRLEEGRIKDKLQKEKNKHAAAKTDAELKETGRERAVTNVAAEGHRDRLRRGERYGSTAGSALGAIGGAAAGRTPITRAAGGALGYLVGGKIGKTVGEEVDIHKNASARFRMALSKLGYAVGQDVEDPGAATTPEGQLAPPETPPAAGQEPQPMMANPPGFQRFNPVNYLEAEATGRAAQEQGESAFYRNKAQAAETQVQSMGQMVQTIQQQLDQLTQQAASSGSMVMQANQEAAAAHDSALQQATLAARMRMGMQALRAQMMEIASQDPEQLSAAAGGPTPTEVGQQMGQGEQQGQAQDAGQQQTPDPSAQAEPGAQPGTPGAAPAEGSQPGTPPPGAGAPGQPAAETQPSSSESVQSPDQSAEMQQKVSSMRETLRSAAPYVGVGAAAGAFDGVRQGGRVDAIQQKVDELKGQQDGGFAKALQLAHTQMNLAQAEDAKRRPVIAGLKGGLRGAGMGAAAAGVVQGGKSALSQAGKNIKEWRSLA